MARRHNRKSKPKHLTKGRYKFFAMVDRVIFTTRTSKRMSILKVSDATRESWWSLKYRQLSRKLIFKF